VILLSTETSNGKSERYVLGTLTISHVAQHLFSGAPILYESIKQDLGLSYTQIGVIVGVANILGGFLQMIYSVAGRWVSRRLLLSGSNFFMSIGCAMTGAAGQFEAVISGNAVAGVGQAGTHPVSSSIIGSKFERKGVGGALSIFYGLGYVGNIISPILLSGIAVLAGWRSAFYLLAILFVIAGIITLWGLRGEASADRAVAKQSNRRLFDDIKSALKVRGAIPILVAQAFISGGTGMGVMTTWVPVYMRDATKGLGLAVGFAGIVSSLATVGGVLGTIYLGKIADQRGYLRIAMFSLMTTTTMIFLLTFYTGFNLLLIPHLFILSMTTFSMSSLLQAHLARSASPAERDILLGLFFTFGFGISSLWSTLLGAVIDTYSFNLVWYTMVGAGVGALICLIIAARSPSLPTTQQ
jgi:FSR family fosmidomycin resistance protein-like MFS transporter